MKQQYEILFRIYYFCCKSCA
ncbi:MAG TPA: TRASH domain-containing protein [Candidatus Coproplasma avicola]|uniref:TRASH domain-containing protein n=1 Tax=Candidatus Coproplasma avicola TaxID=2840744 RepID=A0A9D1E7P8_9FIRM|nr:TRASH domain-containing protein [Candidatus Coproplasma avicola]